MGVFTLDIDRSKLRECQSLAYEAALRHYSAKSSQRSTLIQLPTGTGKTAVIAALPFGLAD